MRVLVTGGRSYKDASRVAEALDAIHAATPIEVIIHGAAEGADRLAAEWAVRRGVPTDPHPAKWDDITTLPCLIKLGKGRRPYNALAGFNRNREMVMQVGTAGICVAFPGGSGTADCRAKALKGGVAVLDVDP